MTATMSPETSTAPAVPAPVTFKVGDEVVIDHRNYIGEVFVITRVNPVKCLVKGIGERPGDRGVNVPKTMLRLNTPDMAPFNPVHNVPTVQAGQLCRLAQPFRSNTTETLMVVTKVNQTTVSLDPVGGRNFGTPMRVSASSLIMVDLADVLR